MFRGMFGSTVNITIAYVRKGNARTKGGLRKMATYFCPRCGKCVKGLRNLRKHMEKAEWDEEIFDWMIGKTVKAVGAEVV